jgi:hypothetical protein
MRYIFLFLFLFSQVLADEDQASVESRIDRSQRPLSALINLGYTSLSNPTGSKLSGPGLELLIQYALNERWATGLGIAQMNLGSSGSASAISFRATYALWGSLRTVEEKVYQDAKLITKSKSLEKSSLCLQLLGSQYFINATRNTVPYSGYGLATYYKFVGTDYANFIVGAKYESVSNTNTLSAINLFAGMEFRL